MAESVLVRKDFRLEPWGKTVIEIERPAGATLKQHTGRCFFLHPSELRNVVRLINLHLRHRDLYVATLENRSGRVLSGEFGAQFVKEGTA